VFQFLQHQACLKGEGDISNIYFNMGERGVVVHTCNYNTCTDFKQKFPHTETGHKKVRINTCLPTLNFRFFFTIPINYTFGSKGVIYCKTGIRHVLANLYRMYSLIHIKTNGQVQQDQLRGPHIHLTSILHASIYDDST
jgi:hypothetical protein